MEACCDCCNYLYSPHFLLFPNPQAVSLYASNPIPGGKQGDSGVDLRFAHSLDIPPTADSLGLPYMIDLEVRARCVLHKQYVPFMVVPRSSISKTPLELANSIGIIDRGYTGTLKVAVRNHSAWVVHLEAGTSLFQLVRPDLEPAIVKVVGEEHEAFRAGASLRGEGGFGSTGASGDGAGGANASANASADASKGVSIGSFGSYESSDVGCGYGSIRGGYESLGIGGARD